MNISRRNFIHSVALSSTAALLGLSSPAYASGKRVVVIGGGSGGATAARYLRLFDSTLQVTLIEPQKRYSSSLMSGEVLIGTREASTLLFDYLKLGQLGIKVVTDWVTSVDSERRRIKTQRGDEFPYDRCIISPGIDFQWSAIEGYNQEIAEKSPHAWNGGEQLITLKKQLTSLQDGGNIVISIPKPPYRCPAAPYERASLMAHYLQQHKPKSKVIILDANSTFSNQRGFKKTWRKYSIEWVSAEEVTAFDVSSKGVTTHSGLQVKADIINIIPPQKAGKIAATAGLVDESGWCPVNLITFESHLKNNIHVIGDAAAIGEMSKLASAANAQGKVCAAAVVALLNGESLNPVPLIETSYSIIGPTAAISRSVVFKPTKGGKSLTLIADSLQAKKAKHRPLREFYNAHSWHNNITRDIFG